MTQQFYLLALQMKRGYPEDRKAADEGNNQIAKDERMIGRDFPVATQNMFLEEKSPL
jgi:hypothetical protein